MDTNDSEWSSRTARTSTCSTLASAASWSHCARRNRSWTGHQLKATDADAEAVGGSSRYVLIGGKERRKAGNGAATCELPAATKAPGVVRGDVYARCPTDTACRGYAAPGALAGKVIAETALPTSLAAQEVLVKEHARLYLPDIFGAMEDDDGLVHGSRLATARSASHRMRFASRAGFPRARDVIPLPVRVDSSLRLRRRHPGTEPFSVERDAMGFPLGALRSEHMKPDQVPGAYEAWLKEQ